jgi:anaerobic selenocysteine-containing dehydrogenase
VVHRRLVYEAKQAVKPSSGLHASSKKASQQVEWSDIGAATISKVAQIIQKHQPLIWYYMMSIAQSDGS